MARGVQQKRSGRERTARLTLNQILHCQASKRMVYQGQADRQKEEGLAG